MKVKQLPFSLQHCKGTTTQVRQVPGAFVNALHTQDRPSTRTHSALLPAPAPCPVPCPPHAPPQPRRRFPSPRSTLKAFAPIVYLLPRLPATPTPHFPTNTFSTPIPKEDIFLQTSRTSTSNLCCRFTQVLPTRSLFRSHTPSRTSTSTLCG